MRGVGDVGGVASASDAPTAGATGPDARSAGVAVAAGEDSVRQGVTLLFVYSLGLGIPFILAAVAIKPFMNALQRFRGHLATVEKVMGALLVLTGILFLTNSMTLIAGWILRTFPSLATIG